MVGTGIPRLSLEAGLIIVNRSRFRPRAWMVDFGFVVHLASKGRIQFLNKGGASDDCSSIQESF